MILVGKAVASLPDHAVVAPHDRCRQSGSSFAGSCLGRAPVTSGLQRRKRSLPWLQ